MAVVLGPNRYGKAETRVVRVTRGPGGHRIKDCNVGVALSGDMDDAHLGRSNAAVLPTDSQKNTVYAFAARHGIEQIEDFALLLARHFVESQRAVHHARVSVEEYPWEPVAGGGHSFAGRGGESRTCVAHHDRDGTATVVSGLAGLVLLNTTGSEFRGFAVDEYTTLAPAADRVLATAVTAMWRHTKTHSGYGESRERARGGLVAAFAGTHSRSLQQTLYAMGERVLADGPELCEVRLSLPNRHHFLVDLTPFGIRNDDEVYQVADRPYGLIEGAVLRAGAPAAGFAFD
ncbi:factor-independent urate hydroxylase [Spongiactinospora sp. TRM90649]|uniref:factor-independent urate hydroxylase n=1 Tax=Spongiactinospora sp. TRM90649 TaxID=3031114 RepID=UPI0023F6AAFA|nr:urate oxidase [Spongiactinospora sp. TRM90649]MDF5756774.1 urate oxidase [Spongiactinospora sp. TRM90649]